MKQFCEYCGSANSYHRDNCKFCGAPFTIRTKVLEDDIEEKNLIKGVSYSTTLSDTYIIFLPILVILIPIMWLVNSFRGVKA